MSAHVADDDVLRLEHLTKVPENTLGHHGTRRVIRVLGVLLEYEVPQSAKLRFMLRLRQLRDPPQGLTHVANDTGGQHVVLIHFGRRFVDV